MWLLPTGDKVEAEMRLGYHVDYYPIADLVAVQSRVTEVEVDALVAEYEKEYDFADNCKAGGKDREQVRCAAREEIALRRFLEEKGAKAFTTNFDDLAGVDQLPGLACQRLWPRVTVSGPKATGKRPPFTVPCGSWVRDCLGAVLSSKIIRSTSTEKQCHTASPHARSVSSYRRT